MISERRKISALTYLLPYQLGMYNSLYLRFHRVHQPHPAHGITGFQFLGDSRRLHHTGQHGVHPFTRHPVNIQQVQVQLFVYSQFPFVFPETKIQKPM